MFTIETERLYTRVLQPEDFDDFHQMMSNPNVMHPIPQEVFTEKESREKLNLLIKQTPLDKLQLRALILKDTHQFIGIAGFILMHNTNGYEIAYRLQEQYWGVGYATEVTKAMIDWFLKKGFKENLYARVKHDNVKSIKVLEKFFSYLRDEYNHEDNCLDRVYELN